MANIATLTVTLSANSARLVNEFNKAQRRSRSFAQRMKRTLAVVGRAFAAMSAAAAGALGALAKSGVDSADQLAKTATKIGATAEELSSLRFAAQQTGVDMRKLDLGLQRAIRRISEAADGSGEAQDAIKELGLSASELERLSPEGVMLELADAFEQVDNQSDRVRLGFKLFDSEGVALINTLRGGREELQKLTEEARQFGLGVSQFQSEKVQEAADAFGRVRSAAEGLRRQLGAAMASDLAEAADGIATFVARLTNGIPKMQAWVDELFNINREIATMSQSQVIARITVLNEQLTNLRNQMANPGARGNLPMEALRQGIEARNKELDDLSQRLVELQEINNRTSPEGGGVEGLDDGSEQVEEAGRNLSRFEQYIASVREEAKRLGRDADKEFRRTKAALDALLSAGDINRRQFEAALEAAREQRNAGLEEIDLDALPKKLAEVRDRSRDTFNQITEFGVQAARNIQDRFAQFLFDPFEDGLDGMLKSFSDTIRRMAAEIASSKLLESFFSLFAGSDGFLGDVAGAFLERRASGGPIQAFKPYLVGERGPEVVMSRQAATVIPNDQIGGSTKVEVNIQNAPQQPEVSTRRVGDRSVVDVIFPPIMRDLAENGPLSRAIGSRFGLSPALGAR